MSQDNQSGLMFPWEWRDQCLSLYANREVSIRFEEPWKGSQHSVRGTGILGLNDPNALDTADPMLGFWNNVPWESASEEISLCGISSTCGLFGLEACPPQDLFCELVWQLDRGVSGCSRDSRERRAPSPSRTEPSASKSPGMRSNWKSSSDVGHLHRPQRPPSQCDKSRPSSTKFGAKLSSNKCHTCRGAKTDLTLRAPIVG